MGRAHQQPATRMRVLLGHLLCLSTALVAAADEKFVFFIFSEKCFATFFTDFNFFHVDCIKSTISKGLSLAIVLGAVALKAPQVLNIVKSKSVTGISLSSLY